MDFGNIAFCLGCVGIFDLISKKFFIRHQIRYFRICKRICTLGHSYGGNTALFLSALDERISFCCASGSACTYKNRMLNGVGIEMASVIPGFIQKYDIDDLVTCIAPRNFN